MLNFFLDHTASVDILFTCRLKKFSMIIDVFYHKGFLKYRLHLYCYFHNVSADMSSGLLRVFVELGI